MLRPMDMMSRRHALRTLALAGLGVAGLASLTSCGEDPAPGGGSATAGLAASDVRRTAGDADALPDVVAALQSFTADLYRVAGAGTGENLVLSPYSVAVALAMTRAGARGETAEQIDAVLHAPDGDRMQGGMNRLTRGVEGRAGRAERGDGTEAEVAIRVASSLWGQRDLTWEQDFLDVLAREYGAGMRLVDYRADADRARELINAWTAERTADKIPELIGEGVLDGLTRLVLVNAVHFKAPWEEPFETTDQGATFTLSDGAPVEVEMVSQTVKSAGYAEGSIGGSRYVAARLPYAGRELAMAVVVPEDLGAFEDGLDGTELADLLASFSPPPAGVQMTMPRWDFRTQVGLKEVLSELGMPTAFDPERADLGGMTAEAELFLTHVLHEATITVDEDGTEAAAATAAVAGVTSAPVDQPRPVTADRPFLFVVAEVDTGAPLFVGRVTDPR